MFKAIVHRTLITKHPIIWVLGFLFSTTLAQAQNLIPNPSFEQFNDITIDDLEKSESTFPGVLDWFECGTNMDAGVTSDTLEALRGHLNFYRPYHGVAYTTVGFIFQKNSNPNSPPEFRNKLLVQCKLTDSLVAGCTYSFSMQVLFEAITYFDHDPYDSLSFSSEYCAIKNIGAHFSTSRIFDSTSARGRTFDDTTIIPQVTLPQSAFITDTTNYTNVGGTFVAQGGEQYLTIGVFEPLDSIVAYNFRTGITDTITKLQGTGGIASRSRLGIDSLHLERLTPPNSLLTTSRDTSLCQGDTLELFANAQQALGYKWDDNSTDSLRIITQPGTYYVDAFYPCGDILSDTIVVTLKNSFTSSSTDTSFCLGDTLQLSPSSFGALAYLWDNNNTDSLRSITSPGIYWVNASYPCGHIVSDTFTVALNDTLPAITVTDTQICEGEAANYSLPPGPTYLLDGDPTANDFTITQEGHHTLTATVECESKTFPFEVSFFDVPIIPNISIKDTSLCEGEEWAILLPDSLNYELNNILVKQNPLFITERNDYNLVADNGCETRVFTFSVNNEGCETLLFVPNAFTPDGDGLNDCFAVSVVEQLNYHIVIFNRWGQLVYESSNPDDCWDGTYLGNLKQDVYTYLITVGAPGREIKERGYVNVVR